MPFNRMRRGRNQQRFRGGMSPIQSVKNSHQQDATTVAGTKNTVNASVTVEQGVATKVTGQEVPTGCKIFSVEVWVNMNSASGAQDGTIDWYMAKLRAGQSLSTDFPDTDLTSTGLSSVRNQIFHQEISNYGSQDAGPYHFHRRIKIPRIYQRQRAGDAIFIAFTSSIIANSQIGFLYKYYT